MKPMLAKNYSDKVDPTGWYMSEKLDGVRAIYYNGVFMSRTEKPFVSPNDFDEGFPQNIVLDGELWKDRGVFSETSGQIRRKTNQDWSEIKYMVFDAPRAEGSFTQRLSVLQKLPKASNLIILKQEICLGRKHLSEYERGILDLGGEGVMLHAAFNYYHKGKRSANVLKVKRFHNAEAVVVGHQPGLGKHKGRMGALICRYKDKQIFIGTGFTDVEREQPPNIGSIVTFKYFEMANNIPRFPVFIAVRNYE